MKLGKALKRFLVPRTAASLYYLMRFGARVSPRAEVELSRNVVLGRGVTISSFAKVKASDGPLIIGRQVAISTGCMLATDIGGIEIGDDCLIGPNVVIVANTYNYSRLDRPMREQGQTSRGVRIGRDVLVGAGVCITDGAVVGNGVIIAPNSVVSTRIPDFGVVQGNPAKVIFVRR